MSGGIGRLAFGIVGAAIGYFTPLGAGVGFVVGSFIGGLVFPEAGPTIEGPRLDDLKVSSSANGNPIPLGAGTMRMPAQVIDATDIVEEKTEQEVGGKGGMMGGGATQVSYKYYANLFLSFGEPLKRSIKGGSALGVLKFFADGKLVFDDSPTNFDTQVQAFVQVTSKGDLNSDGFSYRFYPGTEAQQPDPFFEDLHGVGNVSAYRGQVCVALEHWPLEDYGNRIPIMTAIIVYKGAQLDVTRDEISLEGRVWESVASGMGVNWDYAVGYAINDPDNICKIDLSTLTEIQRGPDTTAYGRPEGEGVSSNLLVAPYSGKIMGGMGGVGPGFGNNQTVVTEVNAETLQVSGRLSADGAFVGITLPTVGNPWGVIGAIGGGRAINDLFTADQQIYTYGIIMNGRDFVIVQLLGNGLNPQTPEVGSLQWVWGGGASDGLGKRSAASEPYWQQVAPGRIFVGQCEFIAVTAGSSDYPQALYRISVQAGAVYRIADNSFAGVSVLMINGDLGLAPGDDCYSIMFDRTDQTHVLQFGVNGGTDLRIMKVDADGNKIWDTGNLSTHGPAGSILNGGQRISQNQSRLATSSICLFSTGTGKTGPFMLDLLTGDVTAPDTDNYAGTQPPMAYDSITRSWVGDGGTFVTGTMQYFCGRLSGLGESLGEINRNIADRLGFETGVTTDVDFTELDPITVPGIGYARQMEGVAAQRPLQQAYNYDLIESDHKIEARLIDKAAALTITDEEIIPEQNDVRPIVLEERVQDVEIPARVNVVYADPSLDYQPGAQREQRILAPVPAVRSQNEVTISLPIAMTAAEAREIAERLLYRGWVERVSLSWQTDWKFIRLEPGDVVTITIPTATFTARITEMDVGADSVIKFKGVSHDTTVFTPSEIVAGTDAGDGLPQTINPNTIATLTFLEEAPLLLDSHNSETTIPIYYGCSGRPGFDNATIYRQEPAGSWEAIDRCVREITRGHATTVLPEPTYGAFITDDESTLTVFVNEGDAELLTSQSDAEFRDNGLVILLGGEVIGIKDASPNTDGSITLSTFYRGLLGTEDKMGSHYIGESWYLLRSAGLMVVQDPLTLLGESNLWKAVADSQSFELAPPISHASNSTPLIPYAPAELEAVNNGNAIDITYKPRSRLTSNLRDGLDAYLESEPSESYEIDIVSSGTVIRTLTTTGRSASYTEGAQLADFGALAGDITINLYKYSSTVGRGKVASISHTGGGAAGSVAPTVVGSVTDYATITPSAYESFSVTPSAGSGNTLLVVCLAYNQSPVSDSDDLRILDGSTGGYVSFDGRQMTHIGQVAQYRNGTYGFVNEVFTLLNPGTAAADVEIEFGNGLAPSTLTAAAFTVQNVNDVAPVSAARSGRATVLADNDSPPTWDSSGATAVNAEDEGTQPVAFYKATDNPTLGILFQCQQDPRKLTAIRAGPYMVSMDYRASDDSTSGNAQRCGYRLMRLSLEGEAGSMLYGHYNHSDHNTTQPRVSADVTFEIYGAN